MRIVRIAASLLLAAATSPFAQLPASAQAPSATTREVRETHHGVEVVDAYRYLEDANDPLTQSFFREQAEHTRAMLDRLPGRDALLKRIRSLSEFQVQVSAVSLEGSRVFYLKAAPGGVNPVLCVREGFAGAERVLVDPERFSKGPRKAAIDWFVASPDGARVAYGVSLGGSEESVLRVLEVSGARDTQLEIDRTRFSERLAWHPDNHSFYYARVPGPADSAKRYAAIRVYRHVIGRETAKDEIVFAAGVGGARDVPEFSYPSLLLPQDSKFAYAVVREGTRRELAVHATEQRELAGGKPRWRKVVGVEDGVTAVEPYRDELLLLSHKGAPRYRVLRIAAANPDLAKPRVVVPEGDTVITSIALAKDALYLRGTYGGVDRLERVPIGLLGLKKPEFVKTPFDTHIAQLETNPRRNGAVLRMQGWIEAPAVLEVDAKSGDLRDTKIQPPPVADFGEMDEVRLYATSHDGTKVPVTLVYKKTTTLNGENPTLLVGYGSYGLPVTPSFDATRLAWLERGGVLALAHVRGGGEYGEAWPRGGQKATKTNTILDFIAVAEFITKYGFTSAGRLAIEGPGAGGIPVGGALARRPDLFAAVVARGALLDMLRFEFAPSGPANVPEFGSIASRAGFDALRQMSAYHQLKDATPYPAVLLSTGMNDTQVEPWHAAKMAARLQAASTSGKPILLRVDTDAGHGPGTPRRQREEERADIYAFLLWQFGHPDFQPSVATPLATPAPPVAQERPAPATR
jgi:prolyl oligopeptidase